MIDSINIHLHDDEAAQVAAERAFSAIMHRNYTRNVSAFNHHIPPIAELIKQAPSGNVSVFCNKFDEANIVDYGEGRVFYGLHPKQEVNAQFASFQQQPLCFNVGQRIDVSEDDRFRGEAPLLPYFDGPLPERVPVMVVLGIGLGYHIENLLKQHQISHLIIYEPDLQIFKSSVLVAPWQDMLRTAKEKKTTLYLQVGNDGNSFFNDIKELATAVPFESVYIYRHYNTPEFNHIIYDMAVNGLDIKDRTQGARSAALPPQYIPRWTGSYRPGYWHPVKQNEKFKTNLEAFKKYVPDVYAQFSDYQPDTWVAVEDGNDINLIHRKLLLSWYADRPLNVSDAQFEGFCRHPRKDGIVLGYKGDKLKHYLHYQFVAKSEEILDEVHEKQQSLPERVKSLIVFGLGSGYDLEALTKHRTVEKLFICEPNRDFFYASLFAIDWAAILKRIDEQEGRIYLNVGDDGTNLFTDLINQFHSIGPYVLAQTYFYQSYVDEKLDDAIAKLREQLQVVIAMGEYFDHAYYGISHTRASITRQHRFLQKGASATLGERCCETPVFIVGNGPSVDEAIETIKTYQHSAIIISCGTAIKVLHRHGIKPDFHAEIEQNRSTFDWVKSIYDDEFLKQIDLLSCNGFHPDTSGLFRQCYLAFKEGESSSLSTLRAVDASKYPRLKFAFPTVSNFVANVVLAWGMKQLYLFGVDLGFKDAKKHHSKSSGYYNENGEEVYDYSEKNNVSIRVPGNFSPLVNTKYEFKVAATSLEQVLAAYRPECYNTADGAKIRGAVPLKLDMILIAKDPALKEGTLDILRNKVYADLPAGSFFESYNKQYSEQVLQQDLKELKNSIEMRFDSEHQIEKLMEKQKVKLFDSYSQGKSLLFYYFYGSMNYYHAVLSKIIGAGLDANNTVSLCEQVREDWQIYFSRMCQQLSLPELAYDVSTAIAQRRVYTCLADSLKGCALTIVTDNENFAQSLRAVVKENNFDLRLCFLPLDIDSVERKALDESIPVVIFLKGNPQQQVLSWVEKIRRRVIVISDDPNDDGSTLLNSKNVMLLRLAGNSMEDDDMPLQANDYFRASLLVSVFQLYEQFDLVLPRVLLSKSNTSPYPLFEERLDNYHVYDIQSGLAFSSQVLCNDALLMPSGHRAMYTSEPVTWDCLTSDKYDQDRLNAYREKQISLRPWLKKT